MRILLFYFLTLTFTLQGQVTSGEITYELKIDQHRNLPMDRPELKNRIPKFRTTNHLLIFTPEASSFTFLKNEENDETEGNGFRRRFRQNRENRVVYRNFADDQSIESSELMRKKFLIKGVPQKINWKITGKTKQVGDYLCQEAEANIEDMKIKVWFTPMIPVSGGPESFGGLPGMILHANINKGEREFTAVTIDGKEIPEGTIIAPSEGEEISRDDFILLRKEKMKEREAERANRPAFSRRRRG